MWLCGNDVTTSWGNGNTQWNPLDEVYLLPKFDAFSFSMTRDFQTGSFADFEQFKIDSHFAVEIGSDFSSLLTLRRSQLFYWLWVRR